MNFGLISREIENLNPIIRPVYEEHFESSFQCNKFRVDPTLKQKVKRIFVKGVGSVFLLSVLHETVDWFVTCMHHELVSLWYNQKLNREADFHTFELYSQEENSWKQSVCENLLYKERGASTGCESRNWHINL